MSDLISRSRILKIMEMWMKVSSYNESERNIMRALYYEVRTAPSAQQWVTVTEGLPDKDVPVLVYLFGDVPHIAWINRDGEWATEEFIIDCDYLPKAWFPLPEPYRGDE